MRKVAWGGAVVVLSMGLGGAAGEVGGRPSHVEAAALTAAAEPVAFRPAAGDQVRIEGGEDMTVRPVTRAASP